MQLTLLGVIINFILWNVYSFDSSVPGQPLIWGRCGSAHGQATQFKFLNHIALVIDVELITEVQSNGIGNKMRGKVAWTRTYSRPRTSPTPQAARIRVHILSYQLDWKLYGLGWPILSLNPSSLFHPTVRAQPSPLTTVLCFLICQMDVMAPISTGCFKDKNR